MKRPVAERFWEKVEVRGPDECWPWLASTTPFGHGQFSFGGKCVAAQRVAWELANNRPVPDGLLVMHSCDNPPCCNPAHLSPGTIADNIRDMWGKGRARAIGPRGERARHAKLTEADVRHIRKRLADGVGIRPLSRELGLDRSTIADIDKRRSWAWLDDDIDTAGRNSGKQQMVRRWVGGPL